MSDAAQLAALGARAARAGADLVPDAVAALAAVLRAQGVPRPVVAAVEALVSSVVQTELRRAGVLHVDAGSVTIRDERP